RVKGQHAVDVREGDLHDPGDLFGGLARDPAPRLLGDPEHGQQRRLFGRVAAENPIDAATSLGGKLSGPAGVFDHVAPMVHQSKAPSFQMYAYPTASTARNTSISMKRGTPPARNATAHGYTNALSITKNLIEMRLREASRSGTPLS